MSVPQADESASRATGTVDAGLATMLSEQLRAYRDKLEHGIAQRATRGMDEPDARESIKVLMKQRRISRAELDALSSQKAERDAAADLRRRPSLGSSVLRSGHRSDLNGERKEREVAFGHLGAGPQD